MEVCPLSNQLLMLLSDLRDHPAATHWVPEGEVAVTVSPDDPSLWGAVGVSYDWFQLFLATGNSTGCVRACVRACTWSFACVRAGALY